jgi:hypothetical protein
MSGCMFSSHQCTRAVAASLRAMLPQRRCCQSPLAGAGALRCTVILLLPCTNIEELSVQLECHVPRLLLMLI